LALHPGARALLHHGPVVGPHQAAALALGGGAEPASRAARLDYATVDAIEPAGVRPVYSIRVDTHEHAFVANAFVNHNTEARLTAAASEWLSDLRPEVVEFRPNFTEKRDEPWVLPVGFPNLLVNGSKGIGWSMACEVPPHNLAEACEAAILLAEEPDAPLEALLERMPGPDFPTGGIVVNPEALAEAYERGQGTFRLQARFHVEQLPGNQQAIVVTELPYGVSPDQVVAEVVKAARAERIQDVTELPKNLSDRSGLRVQIRLKRGGDATRLVADLMRHTSLRVSVGINMTVLVDGVPRLVSLREALDHFVQFRFEVVTRRLVHERDVLLRELHRLVALLAALDAIDEVVRIVRGAEDDDDAREQLKAQLAVKPHGSSRAVPIDDEQAQWILDMPLKRLSRLNRLRLVEERKQKGARVDEIARILESHDELRTIVVRELSHTASRFGGPRRSSLGGEVRRVEERGGKRAMTVVAQPRTDIWVCSTAAGVCAAWPRATRMDGFPVELGAGDRPLLPLATDTEADLNAFAADGTVYRVRAAELPVSARQSKGVRAVGVGRGGQVAALAPLEPEGGFLLLVTARGEVKRVEASVFASSHASGSPAYDVPDGDRIVAVLAHGEGAHALIHSSRGQSLRVELDKLRPVKSPGAGGVAGMRLDGGDEVVAVTLARDGDLLLVAHASGHAKAVPVELFPVKGRGTGGVQSASIDTPRREPAGPVAAACTMAPGDDALVLSLSGAFTAVSPGSLEPVARAAVSRPLAALVVGDEIVAALAVPPPPAAEVSVPAAEPPEAPPGD
jgi:DNA gyrase subunit A